jgi:hypothetical protein
VLGQSDVAAAGQMDELLTPTEGDVSVARLVVRVHCPIEWPAGVRCLNCSTPFPCELSRWGQATLFDAGWTHEQVNALDGRAGAWS